MTVEQMIQICVFLPFAGAAVISLTGANPNVREAVTLITAVILFALVAAIYPTVADGGTPSVVLTEMLPGLSIAFVVEPLGMISAKPWTYRGKTGVPVAVAITATPRRTRPSSPLALRVPSGKTSKDQPRSSKSWHWARLSAEP